MNRLLFGIFSASVTTGFVLGYVFGKYFILRIEKVKPQLENVNVTTT